MTCPHDESKAKLESNFCIERQPERMRRARNHSIFPPRVRTASRIEEHTESTIPFGLEPRPLAAGRPTDPGTIRCLRSSCPRQWQKEARGHWIRRQVRRSQDAFGLLHCGYKILNGSGAYSRAAAQFVQPQGRPTYSVGR